MNYWQEKLIIKNLAFPRFVGGPLDGITDSPFRNLVREFSKEELLFTEMRHVGCVANDKTGRLALNFGQQERPLNYQISACNEQFIDQACERILAQGVDLIDLNIGCPAPVVIKSGAGSALMADLKRLELIVKRLRQQVTIPLTVKIRAGFKQKNAVEVAQLLEQCGIDALTIHPRLQTQQFTGQPDYEIAAAVKKAIHIPVLFSGNVVNWATAKMTYERTGVDGYLIGRGIWGKPWKLKELAEHAAGRPYAITQTELFTYAIKHLEKLLSYYGLKGFYCFRKHVPLYLRGLPNAALLRQQLVTSESVDFVKSVLTELVGSTAQ